MDLSSITNESLIFIHQSWQTQAEVFNHLIDAFVRNDIVTDKEAFLAAVREREAISETGMENGFAIPHGKSTTVSKAAVAIATLDKAMPAGAWPSIDPSNQVELIFLLAIPDAEKGQTHLKILSELSVKLMDPVLVDQLKKARTKTEILQLLSNQNSEMEEVVPMTAKNILAVTACATGIAHTYMAAEALQKAAKEKGITIHVEKQGANGIEDGITPEMIQAADGIIFATDIAPKGKERFKGLPYIQTKVAEPLKHGPAMIDRLITTPDGRVKAADDLSSSDASYGLKKDSVMSTLMQAVMTGISYMIPILVAAGVMIGISQIGASFFGLSKEIGNAEMATNANQLIVLLHYIGLTGNMTMRFMYPIFTAFMAYSIADRPALASGFIGGAFAAGLHQTLWGVEGGIPSGFFGALILGAVSGYVCKFLNEHVKLHKNLQAMKPMLIIPGLSILAVFFVNYLLVDPVFGGLNGWLQQMVMQYQDSGKVVLSTIIACLTAFDLGGPVNKAAGAVAIGMAADQIFPLTPRVLAIVIPPIGIGLATILDKYIVGRRVFDDNLRVTGRTSLVLGFLAIGEGSIPFALQNPLITIPINMIGASIGAVLAVVLGAVQWYPLPAVWSWPLVENFWAYAVGLIAGVLFIALGNIFIRFYLIKKKEAKKA
ncbi:fructose-specific PTS transporter subunit EIIC [Enterococcus thailandicus]|uniref:fructose-specific PTS transporter subunit EIIC n=1 Tax=Enterococcus thailandicus TaxID=417368 RepID=UPI002543F1C4|nr:fructose-specific PTS transporter subunit EIIC [Enterococcus thailandicus]MDK4352188.1 fructose-specific PTS transporter subunit EIIC [Enterococcus thailandicus]MDT2733132.1 fructose-specific PTS transporter subunit EIIC [Enterococcus thailandicus]